MKYLIETIGCQMNVCESDALSNMLSNYGMLQVHNIVDADVIILNTCSVRAQAEQKAFSYIGRVEELKKQKPNVKIIVIGCMAERLGIKIRKRFKSVDLVIGSKNINNFALKIVNLCNLAKIDNNILSKKSTEVGRCITIIRGCNNFCSYCVVPFVRGQEVSLDNKIIISECEEMVKSGAKEIMLLGQNVNSYKHGTVDFVSLVRDICKIDGLERLRFMTNHPKNLSDDLINLIATEKKVCHHVHLPMQSGSNKVLKEMNRNYTYEYYLALINKLRSKIADISITTDIIVGFPGETEKDFNNTLKALKDIFFDGLYVFRYSSRPNTRASRMVDDVPLEEKKRRHSIILNESNKISSEIVLSMVGKTFEVLVENFKSNILEGRTGGGRKVFIKSTSKDYVGKVFNVHISESKINSLFGNIV
ncbi:MAG: tRNA (N6-isopentenyl adenosine(37)-C2)-methylthiotransferase MiaB [Endomicrobium sp.]|uniref:tRNA (N6-isopentenyl adenosine(37)-C2)-methylthiotransferase MiaB n=1 Tax=Candidatus Endomicrobiellum cubanum TaxID=3242325 RepID=UPI0028387251|nr:tRNA (N6-isopentenyl adenosine(37)-C2)-methylthiotransferase MiaB [Endomicrobium sp.]